MVSGSKYVVVQNQSQDCMFDTSSNAHIIDLGCGSGRDSKAFINKGYKVTAVDGSKELAKIAS